MHHVKKIIDKLYLLYKIIPEFQLKLDLQIRTTVKNATSKWATMTNGATLAVILQLKVKGGNMRKEPETRGCSEDEQKLGQEMLDEIYENAERRKNIIYMEDFQMRAKHDDFPELTQWPWYVDDSVLKCKRDKATSILDHLNSIEPNVIKFTKEEEEENRLAVLDLELDVNPKKKKILTRKNTSPSEK